MEACLERAKGRNKVTGAILFALPLSFRFIDPGYCILAICVVTTFMAIREVHFNKTERIE